MDTTDLITFHHTTSDPETRDPPARRLDMRPSFSLLDVFERALTISTEPAVTARIEELMAEHRVALSTSRSIARRSMAEVLPPETLTVISLFLDVSSIRSYRSVCRVFEKAAWPAFAAIFNDTIFFPTEKSIKILNQLARNAAFVPYFEQLKIGTIKVIPAVKKATRENMVSLMKQYPDEGKVPQNPGQVQWIIEREERIGLAYMLRDALRKLTNLETICIINVDDRCVIS